MFDSEAGSDVIFLVGNEPETWRFPGHKRILCEANPVFKAMLENFQECENGEQTISIQDVDGRAFDLLLRLVVSVFMLILPKLFDINNKVLSMLTKTKLLTMNKSTMNK